MKILFITAFATLSLAGNNRPYMAGEFSPCLNQQQQPQQSQPLQLQRGPIALAPSCQQSSLPPARLLDWPSMRAAYSLLQDNQVPAARLGCDGGECAVVVVDARILVAHVVVGVPRRLCSGLLEVCQRERGVEQPGVVENATTTAEPQSLSTGCPVTPSVCTASANVNATTQQQQQQQFAIVNVTAPYYMAQSVCARLGMSLADISIQTFLSAVDTVLQCVGPRQRAWVASWNGDTYGNQTCLALTVGDQSGGGAINPVANCTEPLPVLCQSTPSKSTSQPACGDSEYAVVQGVQGNDTASACSSINMSPVDVTPANARAISRSLLNCPAAANQTAWVSSYSGGARSLRVLRAAECGCVGVVAVAPGKLVAVRPLFECQCVERRVALCGRVPASTVVGQQPVQPTPQPSPYQQQSYQQPQGYGATVA